MAVEVFNENAQSVINVPGELVCTKPFPSMPLGFWQDEQQQKYREAYFIHFPSVWWHGDYAELTQHGGMIMYGRADNVLNPGGVRIGTAEIYRPLANIPEIVDSIVAGQQWDNSERIILFVKLQEGETLTETLQTHIKTIICFPGFPASYAR